MVIPKPKSHLIVQPSNPLRAMSIDTCHLVPDTTSSNWRKTDAEFLRVRSEHGGGQILRAEDLNLNNGARRVAVCSNCHISRRIVESRDFIKIPITLSVTQGTDVTGYGDTLGSRSPSRQMYGRRREVTFSHFTSRVIRSLALESKAKKKKIITGSQ